MSVDPEAAKSAVSQLLSYDEDRLLEELGKRTQINKTNPEIMGSYMPPEETMEHMDVGASELLKKFGLKFFDNFGQQLYKILCDESPEHTEERNKLSAALKISQTDVATTLTAIIVAVFPPTAIPAAVAVVLAALITKLFYDPAQKAICQVWSEELTKKSSGASADAQPAK